jgi:hypothetical protein
MSQGSKPVVVRSIDDVATQERTLGRDILGIGSQGTLRR